MKTVKLVVYVFSFFYCTMAISQFRFYRDKDGDGLGSSQYITNSYPPPGYVGNSDDCDDNNSNIGRAKTWYRDADGDGLGNPNVSSVSCTQPNGYVLNNNDVDDGDDDVTDIPPTRFYRDVDGDSWGSSYSIVSSYPPPGYTYRDGDCNDNDNTIYPGAVEFCDGKDNNCNGQTDEGSIAVPNMPSISNNCGNTILTKPAPTGNVTLYWQTSASGKSTANSSNTVTLTSGTVYYIRARANNANGCWSDVRTINYNINRVPGIATGSNKSRCGAGSLTLSASPGNNANQIRWYTSSTGGTSIHTGTSFTTPSISASTTYYAESYNTSTQCKAGSRRAIQAQIMETFTYYEDADNDGLGDPANAIVQCEQPAGYVLNATDNCPEFYNPDNECVFPISSDPQTHNYIYSRTYQQPTSSIPTSKFEDNDDYIQSITYYDGIGRPRQQVGIRQAPDSLDIVTHIGYDEYSRKIKDWLPFHEPTETRGYFRTGDLEASTKAYHKLKYTDDFPNMSNGAVNAYSEKTFEASPLNRVLKQAAPGKDWKMGNGHEMEFHYDTNGTNEVRFFKANTSFTGGIYEPTLVQNGHYTAKRLYKNVTYDENHDGSSSKLHTTEEFTDKLGRLVLKRTYADLSPSGGDTEGAHDTYYVYDKYSNLTYVIPPKVDTSNGVSSTERNELCYQYKYDHRNRLVEKKLPGKGWEHIVYNTLDQPVMTQDAVQRTNNEWSYTKYDAFGRVVLAGILDLSVTRSQAQTNVENAAAQYEKRVGDVYSNDTYPSIFNSFGVPQIHVLNFYDDYEFPLFGYSLPTTVLGQTVTQNVKGLPTGGGILVLDGNDDKWVRWAKAYDEKGRVIAEGNINELLQTFIQVETKLDFVGRPEQVVTTHTKGTSSPLVTVDNFEYDHMGRLTKQTQTIGSHTETLVENTYDELGQLVQKKVGGNLQTVDYKYNVRGWMTAMNDVNNLGSDLFAFGINYNTPTHGSTALYNGNIAETEWRTANTDSNLKWYRYGYDALNRIENATGNSSNYNLVNVDYDKNGNITALNRRGHTNNGATSFGTMDNLVYGYHSSGNRLRNVADSANDTYGFKDTNGSGTEYSYDSNGNMTIDLNKGIRGATTTDPGIVYNHLNLPMSISINGNGNNGTISYIYDATGTKLRKTVGSSVTDYAGNYVYQNGQLQFFGHPEGYVTPDGQGSYDYVYNYVDHLGNVRLAYMGKVLMNDSFETSLDGWQGQSASIALENGRLKVTADNRWNGAQKYVDVSVGDVIDYELELDKGSTEKLVLVIYEHDNNYTKLKTTVPSTDANGVMSGSYTVTTGTKLRLKVEKGLGSDNGTDTHFYLDNVYVTNGDVEILQENNYYPFGLKHKGYNDGVSPLGNSVAKKWKYNGMEYDESLGLETYDFGARNYDPALGRWMNIDPLAEQMRRHSPYNYAYNNPVAFIDPDGMLGQAAWASAFGVSLNILGSMFTESEAAENRRENDSTNDEVSNQDTDAGISSDQSTTNEIQENPCKNCPNKDLKAMALMMVNQYGGNAQDYYNMLANPEQVIEERSTWGILILGTLAGGVPGAGATASSSGGTKGVIGFMLSGVRTNNIARIFAKNSKIFSGQSHFSKKIANKYLKQMKNNQFNNYTELSALMDKSGRTIMTGGNHRMNAAIRYGAETGDYRYVKSLLEATRITSGEASSYGYAIKNIIR